MARDRITGIRIRGMRVLADVDLDLDGLTVVIGENGSGKSTIIEAFELARRMANPHFIAEWDGMHGGSKALARTPADRIGIEVRAVIDSAVYTYSVEIDGSGSIIRREELGSGNSAPILLREPGRTEIDGLSEDSTGKLEIKPTQLLLPSFGVNPPSPVMTGLMSLLGAIEVHVPFNVQPTWVARATKRFSQLRESCYIKSADRLELFAANLPNAWYELNSNRGEEHRRRTLELVRLGLGEDVEAVTTPADASGGAISVAIKYRYDDHPIPAALLSDGELAFLALVATFRLGDLRSLLAFDEPDLHLHPKLLFRIVGMLEETAENHPVVVTTHSDVLLDALSDPASSVVVSELDENRTTSLSRLDRVELGKWLDDYKGFGELRNRGYDRLVVMKDEEP